MIATSAQASEYSGIVKIFFTHVIAGIAFLVLLNLLSNAFEERQEYKTADSSQELAHSFAYFAFAWVAPAALAAFVASAVVDKKSVDSSLGEPAAVVEPQELSPGLPLGLAPC